jgi:integrase
MPRRPTTRATGVWERDAGSNVWWIRYRVNGVLKREKVGRRSDAIALYQRRKSEIRAGAKLPENFRAASVRFRALAEEVVSFSQKHHRDRRTVESRLRKILPAFGDRYADQIKPVELDDWLARNTNTPATANRYRALFSLIFREAIRNGRASQNPARLVRMRAEANGRIRFLTDAEEKRLRVVVAKLYPHRMPDLTIALGTGMRLSEQFSLTWDQIDFDRSEINLDRSKNGSGRSIPMNKAVRSSFAELKRNDAHAGKGDRVFDTKNPRGWFHAALDEAKIVRYRWHDHRHTFCSRLAMRGENLKVIQELAGHKTIQMSARYAHLGHTTLRAAVEGLC